MKENKSSDIAFINVAICDDEIIIHKQIDDILLYYGKLRDISIKCLHFYNASELTKYDGNIHILLLDIAMPEMDGIEAGLILRKKGRDYRIIMLTGMKEKAADSLKIGAFRFLTKPLDKADLLFEAFDEALITFMGYKKTEVKYKNTTIQIYQYQIEHIISMGNYVKIFSRDKTYEKYTSVRKFMTELDERMFIQTDKSTIVNLANVHEIVKNNCILDSGKVIHVSRRAYKDFVIAHSLYDAKGYKGIRNGSFF